MLYVNLNQAMRETFNAATDEIYPTATELA